MVYYMTHPGPKLSWVLDFAFIVGIVAVGWFLIGFYLEGEFLITGYQDWFHHAYRIRHIAEYGLSSWNHQWSLGLPFWRSYQFIPHLLVLGVSGLFGLTIPKGLLTVTVFVFIASRVMMYVVLRMIGISALPALLATIVSYAFMQQWIAIKEFSIFASLIFVPILTYIWILSFKRTSLLLFLSALLGGLWSVHLVFAYTFAGLFFLTLIARRAQLSTKYIVYCLVLYFISSSYFFAQYLFTGYFYMNPIFSSAIFLKETIIYEYFGLSLIYYMLMGLSWIVMIVRIHTFPQWAKLLLLYSCIYVLFIFLGVGGYLPSFVNGLQISRGITIIGLLLPFVFGIAIQSFYSSIKSIILSSIIVVLIAVTIIESVSLGSIHTAAPVTKVDDPVAEYFVNKETTGRVFVDDVSKASFFTKAPLNYATSLMEHREPHPLSQRFRYLLRSDSAYTGVTQKQLDTINNYSLVMGVEYVVLPELSPLVDAMTASESGGIYQREDEVIVSSGVYEVLKRREPVSLGYVVNKEQVGRFVDLEKPTLSTRSYAEWDEKVAQLAKLIRERSAVPVSVQLKQPNGISVDLTRAGEVENPVLLLSESYDDYWSVEGGRAKASPHTTRLMQLEFAGSVPSQLNLTHQWPAWHWPLHFVSLVTIGITGILTLLRRQL